MEKIELMYLSALIAGSAAMILTFLGIWVNL